MALIRAAYGRHEQKNGTRVLVAVRREWPLLVATAFGICRGRIVARHPVRIGLVGSVVGVKYARARYSPVTPRATSVIDFGLSSHPYVPLVRWLRRHGLCPCGDRQGERYSEMPHHSFLLAMADHRQQRWRAAIPFKPDDCSYVNLGGSCQLSLLKPSEKSGSLPQRITRKGQEAPTPCPRLLQSCLKDTGQCKSTPPKWRS
jgi:hypothetical protein